MQIDRNLSTASPQRRKSRRTEKQQHSSEAVVQPKGYFCHVSPHPCVCPKMSSNPGRCPSNSRLSSVLSSDFVVISCLLQKRLVDWTVHRSVIVTRTHGKQIFPPAVRSALLSCRRAAAFPASFCSVRRLGCFVVDVAEEQLKILTNLHAGRSFLGIPFRLS